MARGTAPQRRAKRPPAPARTDGAAAATPGELRRVFHDLANALGVAQIRILDLTEDAPAGSPRRKILDAIAAAIADGVAAARELRTVVDGAIAARAGGRHGTRRTGSS